MIDPACLVDDFQQLTREQVKLAIVAEAPPVAAMHIDLALFGAEQVRLTEQLCEAEKRPRRAALAA